MAIQKSYVITDSSKLDRFFARNADIEGLELKVGILEGKTRYEPRHVGSKSRAARRGKGPLKAEVLDRRRNIRELRSALTKVGAEKGRKVQRAMEKDIRAAFRSRGVSSKGLRKSARGTSVAKVAGVLQAGQPYHVIAMKGRATQLRRELQGIMDAMLRDKNPASLVRLIGERSVDAVQRAMTTAGHVDTGLLFRTTKFEIIDVKGRGFAQRVARARRVARKRARG